MLNTKQKKAVRLLFELPEDKVAEELGIRPDTLRRWKGKKEFVSAMQTIEQEVRISTTRILSRGLAHAAARVCGMVAVDADCQPAKTDLKSMVDLLKGAGALEATQKELPSGGGLAEVIAELAAEQEVSNGRA